MKRRYKTTTAQPTGTPPSTSWRTALRARLNAKSCRVRIKPVFPSRYGFHAGGWRVLRRRGFFLWSSYSPERDRWTRSKGPIPSEEDRGDRNRRRVRRPPEHGDLCCQINYCGWDNGLEFEIRGDFLLRRTLQAYINPPYVAASTECCGFDLQMMQHFV